MTVDEYKKKYGDHSLHKFWNVGAIIHSYEIPVNLYGIIDDTIKELNQIYIPFTWLWILQRKPKIQNEIREIEDQVNVSILCNDEENLKESLRLYYEIWLEAILEFDLVKDKFIPF